MTFTRHADPPRSRRRDEVADTHVPFSLSLFPSFLFSLLVANRRLLVLHTTFSPPQHLPSTTTTTTTKMATPRSAKKAARKSGSKSAKAGLIFPVGRVGSLLRKGQYARRVSASGALYLSATLEYLTAELLELTVKAAAQSGKKVRRLSPRTLTLAVRHDDDIGSLLKNVTFSKGGVVPTVSKAVAKKHKKSSKRAKKSTPSA
ncbi:histone H2A [Strigomonas culicis]|uniref:Histone H2A n=1 Tax=Strigomonas culicis TaxID=28005 RepID=S9VEP4_9TRYP|nr:histone H2A [Strigomonas culicis]|eukprot:EPY25566.1 histone H2A [Strigomonas culicis]